MRILLLSNSYAPILGGLQTVTHKMAQQLLERGHKVLVVTKRHPWSLPAQEKLDGVSIRRWLFLTPDLGMLRRGRADLFLASLPICPLTRFRLSRLVGEFQPDVVNVHFPDSQIPFVLRLRERFDFRLVASLHGHEVLRYFREPKNEQKEVIEKLEIEHLRALLREADAVTACSSYLLDRAIEIEPTIADKGYPIHNGVDVSRFEDRRTYEHTCPYILAYGRLTYKKGFDLLLQAFGRVASEQPNLDLIIAGAGEQQDELETLASNLQIHDRITFFGRASSREIVALLNGCEFVIVPSRQETFGIVALEAIAAGKPVLATRVGGLAEFAQESPLVHLVEPTLEALTRGIASMLQNTPSVQSAASDKFLHKFTWQKMIDQYESVFKGNL